LELLYQIFALATSFNVLTSDLARQAELQSSASVGYQQTLQPDIQALDQTQTADIQTFTKSSQLH
jgi:hypothetical protein